MLTLHDAVCLLLPVPDLGSVSLPQCFPAGLRAGAACRAATVTRSLSLSRAAPDPRQLPNVVASFWERISCLPSGLDSADQQAVLAAVDAHSTPISPDLRPELGSLAVSAAEVARALQQAKPGTSPGWDGIPVDLLRTYSGCFVPALARLFTAIGHLRAVPTGFLKGVISVIYKGHDADRAAAGAYRPITLLCTDYRLLAKVLANRLSPGLSAAIPLEQSAFLPGRSIGANTRFLRCLPPLLRQQQRSALIAFLDFAKAYDTIDRSFLFAVMERMGVGADFLGWTQLLLGRTVAMASVNGYISRSVPIRAGVRQGCPLAPLLYLFVAHALLCWLKRHGVGVPLAPADPASLVTGVQFADDAPSRAPRCSSSPAISRPHGGVCPRLWPAPESLQGRAAVGWSPGGDGARRPGCRTCRCGGGRSRPCRQ